MSQPEAQADALQVRRRRWTRWLWIPVLLLVLVAGYWWRAHPADLPTSGTAVEGEIRAGQTLYLGVPASVDPSRAISIDDVELTVTSDPRQDVDAILWVCAGGSIGQTTTPERFCESWHEAQGRDVELGGGDSLVVGVQAPTAGTVEVERITLDFGDGLQRGTSRVGAPIVVQILG